ncbi:insulin-like growth factor 3 [Scleropages formosus]|uniref:insulin-like growth factor 3 n=1 Tax=Scleropages formosus TaxID=113540 RepID=UPI0010FA722B|nr:insulin-like growth factor I [Scleropages formosus]
MHSLGRPARCPRARGCLPKVCCWWCGVCVLYPVLCLAALRGGAEAMKARCGRELVADLEFVCGDRGFYRGKAATSRGGTRLRGKGIVEQCCLRGCDLLDLEAYCAKPRRSRRFAPAAAPPPQATEDVNMAELRRRTGRPPKPVAAAHDGSAPQESLATLPRRGLGKARRGARWGR